MGQKSSHWLQVNSCTDMNISKYSTQIIRKSVYLYEYCWSSMLKYGLYGKRMIYIFFEILQPIHFQTTHSIIIKLYESLSSWSTLSYDSFDFDQSIFRTKILKVKGNVSKKEAYQSKKRINLSTDIRFRVVYTVQSLNFIRWTYGSLWGSKTMNSSTVWSAIKSKKVLSIVEKRNVPHCQQWCIHINKVYRHMMQG